MLIKISFHFIARKCDVNIFRNSLPVFGRFRATNEFGTKSIVYSSFHVSPNQSKFIGNSRRKCHSQICTNRTEGNETYGDHMCAAQLCTKCRNRYTEIVHRKLKHGKKLNSLNFTRMFHNHCFSFSRFLFMQCVSKMPSIEICSAIQTKSI